MLRASVRAALCAMCFGMSWALVGACGSNSGGGTSNASGAGGGSEGPQTCRRNSDCPGTLLCDRTAESCVECLSARDCETGSECAAGTCHPRCSSETDCQATNQLCSDAGV